MEGMTSERKGKAGVKVCIAISLGKLTIGTSVYIHVFFIQSLSTLFVINSFFLITCTMYYVCYNPGWDTTKNGQSECLYIKYILI